MATQNTPNASMFPNSSPNPAHDMKDRAADTIEKLGEAAAGKLHDVTGQAEHIASVVAEQGREAGEKIQQVAGNLKGAVDQSVKDQPMATLAIAVAFGFVLGAIWKS